MRLYIFLYDGIHINSSWLAIILLVFANSSWLAIILLVFANSSWLAIIVLVIANSSWLAVTVLVSQDWAMDLFLKTFSWGTFYCPALVKKSESNH